MATEINSILTRLQLCNDDISGLTSFREPPPQVEVDYPPFIYIIPPSYTETVHTGHALRTFTIPMECLVRPFGERGLTTAQETSLGVQEMLTYLELITDYYNTHRRLQTDSLAALEFVIADITLQGTPQFPITGHDGNPYFGLVITLTVQVLVKT